MKNHLIALTLALIITGRVFASPTDIVPEGSSLLDAFATLARSDAFSASDTPEDFLGEPLYTREQLARRLEHLVQDEPKKFAKVQGDPAQTAALHAAMADLQPELTADGVNFTETDTSTGGTSVSGYLQPEARLRVGGDAQPKSGAIGVYRVTALGSLRSNIRFVLSASNWPEDGRRNFTNDIGSHDFSAVNEAYLALNAGRGLTFKLGRMYDRWGPGYRGATMLSDNAPALNQLQVGFPFSLGAKFGREYHFTQMAALYKANGSNEYFEARRIEYHFSSQWDADFQEAFLANRSWALEFTPFPDFYTAKNANIPLLGIREKNLDPNYKAAYNFTASYHTPDDRLRLYGQFLVHDLQSPGHSTYQTPRKIAYLVGTALQPLPGTGVVAEYTFADPTTYSSRTISTQWQEGQYDEIGLPTGPNGNEIYGRFSQHLLRGLNFALEGREKKRHNETFGVPDSRDVAASLDYAINHQAGLKITYQDYRQTAFPLAPNVPLVGDGFTPANAESFYGQNLRIKQVDVAYRYYF